MKIFADIKDKTFIFEQFMQNGTPVIRKDNKDQTFRFESLGRNRYSLIINNRSFLVNILRKDGIYHVNVDGEYFPIRVEDERSKTLRELVQHASKGSADQVIVAPIPGLITQIKIKEGDEIKQGDGLIILEAMKMENEIKAQVDGVVKEVLVQKGSPVDKDQKLIVIT